MSFPNDYWQQKYRQESCKSWNLFYRRNSTHFFKDRHWTLREFPELSQVRVHPGGGMWRGQLYSPTFGREQEYREGVGV